MERIHQLEYLHYLTLLIKCVDSHVAVLVRISIQHVAANRELGDHIVPLSNDFVYFDLPGCE